MSFTTAVAHIWIYLYQSFGTHLDLSYFLVLLTRTVELLFLFSSPKLWICHFVFLTRTVAHCISSKVLHCSSSTTVQLLTWGERSTLSFSILKTWGKKTLLWRGCTPPHTQAHWSTPPTPFVTWKEALSVDFKFKHKHKYSWMCSDNLCLLTS